MSENSKSQTTAGAPQEHRISTGSETTPKGFDQEQAAAICEGANDAWREMQKEAIGAADARARDGGKSQTTELIEASRALVMYFNEYIADLPPGATEYIRNLWNAMCAAERANAD